MERRCNGAGEECWNGKFQRCGSNRLRERYMLDCRCFGIVRYIHIFSYDSRPSYRGRKKTNNNPINAAPPAAPSSAVFVISRCVTAILRSENNFRMASS